MKKKHNLDSTLIGTIEVNPEKRCPLQVRFARRGGGCTRKRSSNLEKHRMFRPVCLATLLMDDPSDVLWGLGLPLDLAATRSKV